jgi:hypothetical protein
MHCSNDESGLCSGDALKGFGMTPRLMGPKIEPSRSCGVLLGLARLQRRREMIEFLVQMPTARIIFLATAVLSLATTLIVLRWLI